MKLRYKVSIVIVCFFVFYKVIVPIGSGCADPIADCHFLWDLTKHLMLTVPSDGGIIEYSGTVQGMEEPSVETFIRQNVSFFAIMVVIPMCVIGAIIFYDRRKIKA